MQPRQAKLQREADFTGARLETFGAVFVRHGLPGAVLAIVSWLYLFRDLDGLGGQFVADPQSYGVGILVTLLLCNLYAWRAEGHWGWRQFGWVVYLGLLSLWEEWLFRVALPDLMISVGAGLVLAVVVSNVLFGLLHYFTLRWRWQWCLGAAIGGLLLSRHFETHDNFALIVLFHWVGTFFNTPRLPSKSR